MPGKPIFLQTKAGTKLLSGTLSFFQHGTDDKLYHVEVGQVLFADPFPVGHVFPSDRIGEMTAARSARPIPVGWTPAPITKYNLAPPLRPLQEEGTQTYLNRKTVGATPGGPILQQTGSKYYLISPKMLLDEYEKKIWNERLEQIEQAKSDAKMQRLIEELDDLLEVVGTTLKYVAMLLPQARIGAVALEMLQDALAAFKLSQATSEAAALNILKDKAIDLVFDAKIVMPTWAKIVAQKKVKDFTNFRIHDEKTPPQSDLRVPADYELDQIYRFRCIAQPEVMKERVKEFEMIKKKVAGLKAKGLIPAHRTQ